MKAHRVITAVLLDWPVPVMELVWHNSIHANHKYAIKHELPLTTATQLVAAQDDISSLPSTHSVDTHGTTIPDNCDANTIEHSS